METRRKLPARPQSQSPVLSLLHGRNKAFGSPSSPPLLGGEGPTAGRGHWGTSGELLSCCVPQFPTTEDNHNSTFLMRSL